MLFWTQQAVADPGETEQGHPPAHDAHYTRCVGQVEALRLQALDANINTVLPPSELHRQRQPVHIRHHKAGLMVAWFILTA